jgi:hypothetical protein
MSLINRDPHSKHTDITGKQTVNRLATHDGGRRPLDKHCLRPVIRHVLSNIVRRASCADDDYFLRADAGGGPVFA